MDWKTRSLSPRLASDLKHVRFQAPGISLVHRSTWMDQGISKNIVYRFPLIDSYESIDAKCETVESLKLQIREKHGLYTN